MTSDRSRILVVDDEQNLQEMLQRRFARGGYDCVTASSADEAADILQREKFDLILLDILMPDKSGMEFLPDVLARYPDMAVVMLTAVTDTATAVRALRDGASDYVTKPLNMDQLVTRISRALDRRAGMLRDRDYQENLEKIVGERTERVEQRMREVTALNNLIRSQMDKILGGQEAYARLQSALTEFATQLEELARHAKVVGSDNDDALADLRQAFQDESPGE